MTRALSAAFKSQLVALADRHQLSPDEWLSGGLSFPAHRAMAAGMDREALWAALDVALLEGAPHIDGFTAEAAKAASVTLANGGQAG